MRASDLRHRITFQRRSTETDAYGADLVAWVDVATNIPAGISPLNGRELMAAKAVQSEVTHQIDIRYQTFLANPKDSAAMRIVYRDRHFNIQSVLNVDERRREMRIMAAEGLNDG